MSIVIQRGSNSAGNHEYLAFDHPITLSRYAKAGIPEVWIVNIADLRTECYRDPSEDGYGVTAEFGENDSLTSVHVPALGQMAIG